MVEVIAKRPQKKRRRAGRKMFSRHKVCRFCADKELEIDYKDAKTLRIFLTERCKIIPRRISGNCASPPALAGPARSSARATWRSCRTPRPTPRRPAWPRSK